MASFWLPWAELLPRTFAVDVLVCPTCPSRMKLLETDPQVGVLRRVHPVVM